jgi:hypothetical protein
MTNDLDSMIEFENENTNLDFKAIQYKKPQFKDLLKDLISMANARTDADKYIIVGIKLLDNGDRNILGITENFIDEATYQQLVNNNIEPELNVSYVPYKFEDKTLGIFKISDSNDRPYMMKKDFEKLNIGDSFIRKGSHQTRLTRKDISFYIERKIGENKFKGGILTYFNEVNQKSATYKILEKKEVPSEIESEKIKKVLLKKKQTLKDYRGIFPLHITQGIPLMYKKAYEDMSIETLEEALKNVSNNYKEEDLNYFLELKSNKLNFKILNNTTEYLEDTSIELRIEKKGLYIADRVHLTSKSTYLHALDNKNYSEVIENETEYIINENIGDLKHQISRDALRSDLRIAITNPEMVRDERTVKIKIFGKNLKEPIEDELTIKFLE